MNPYREPSADTVAVCPECETSCVHINAPGGYADVPEGDRYRCPECGATFEEYDERERQRSVVTRRGLAKKLADANPEEVGR